MGPTEYFNDLTFAQNNKVEFRFDDILFKIFDKREVVSLTMMLKDLEELEKGRELYPTLFAEKRKFKKKTREEELSVLRNALEQNIVDSLLSEIDKDSYMVYINILGKMNHTESNGNSTRKRPQLNRNSAMRKQLDQSGFFNLKSQWVDTTNSNMDTARYNVVDLFSGAGGISCGLRQAGYRPILGVEIDPDAASTYKLNFPNVPLFHGDIRKLSSEKLLDFVRGKTVHLVTGGFPCQGFSLAGYRDPNDERNKLYKEVVRVVQVLKPWYVVLENVPGIMTMTNGRVVETIINDFESIGYPEMSVHLLESAAYGVPQLRPRAIFIANRYGLKNPYPKPQLDSSHYVPIERAIDDLKERGPDKSINHLWTRHSPQFIERIKEVGPGESLYKTYQDAFKRQYKGVPAMTIKENHGGTHIHYELNRCISAREMARLQSFPDTFIFCGTMKRAMWQIGNAVPPLLFKNIGLALLPKLEEIRMKTSLVSQPFVEIVSPLR